MSGRRWALGGLCVLAGLAGRTGGVSAQAPAPATAPASAPAAAATAPAAPNLKQAALVGGEPITRADVDLLMRSRQPETQPLTAQQQHQQRVEALYYLIDETLLNQFLRKTTTPVPPAEINTQLDEMKKGLAKQGKTLEQFCKENGQTESDMRAVVAHHLQWQQYTRAHVAEADLEKYYQYYKDFFDDVTVRVSHILLRVPPSSPPAEREKSRARLVQLRADLLANKLDFAQAVKQYSHCDFSAGNGGDLGYVPRKFALPEAVSRAAFATPVGQLSDVIEADYGFHLLKVTDRKPGAKPSEYASIKDKVRYMYELDMRQQIIEQQRKTTKVEIKPEALQ